MTLLFYLYTTDMNRLIVANWKHNPATASAAHELAAQTAGIEAVEGVQVVVCPPYTYVETIHEAQPQLVLGSQDISTQDIGAHTGEVGGEILKNLGVQYAIIGHSERRAMGESDEEVTYKVRAASAAGIMPIVCVGEDEEVREAGMDAVYAFLQEQLSAIPDVAQLVVAYEPIWAIGTGKADNPASAGEVARYIKEYLGYLNIEVRVLYGGSANPENAAGFLNEPGIGGLLVGGASLDEEKFAAIVHAR